MKKKICMANGKLKMANNTDYSKILDEKDLKILQLLVESPEGLRKRTITRQTHFAERTAYNHLQKLASKEVNLILHLTPIYKVAKLPEAQEILATLSKSNNMTNQGHHISWVLPLVNKPHWWDKRKDRLMRLQEWIFKKDVTANNTEYQQIYKKGYMQIQTYKNSIYFICQRDYRELSDLEIFNKSKDDVLEAINYLEEQFRFKFLAENHFHLTFVDAHYVSIKDALAEVAFKEGKRFRIETKEGYHLWIDFSDPRGLEGDNVEAKRRYLELIKDVADNPETPLLSELNNQIEKLKKENSYLKLENEKDRKGLSKELMQMTQLMEQMKNHMKSQDEVIFELIKEKGKDK